MQIRYVKKLPTSADYLFMFHSYGGDITDVSWIKNDTIYVTSEYLQSRLLAYETMMILQNFKMKQRATLILFLYGTNFRGLYKPYSKAVAYFNHSKYLNLIGAFRISMSNTPVHIYFDAVAEAIRLFPSKVMQSEKAVPIYKNGEKIVTIYWPKHTYLAQRLSNYTSLLYIDPSIPLKTIWEMISYGAVAGYLPPHKRMERWYEIYKILA